MALGPLRGRLRGVATSFGRAEVGGGRHSGGGESGHLESELLYRFFFFFALRFIFFFEGWGG